MAGFSVAPCSVEARVPEMIGHQSQVTRLIPEPGPRCMSQGVNSTELDPGGPADASLFYLVHTVPLEAYLSALVGEINGLDN